MKQVKPFSEAITFFFQIGNKHLENYQAPQIRLVIILTRLTVIPCYRYVSFVILVCLVQSSVYPLTLSKQEMDILAQWIYYY